jgi:hypothetical protein
LRISGSLTLARAINLNAFTNIIHNDKSVVTTLSGAMSGSGTLHQQGQGTIVLGSKNMDNYFGEIYVWNDSTLRITASQALRSGAVPVHLFDSGEVHPLTRSTLSIESPLTLSIIYFDSAQSTIAVTSAAVTAILSEINNYDGLIKTGPGTLILGTIGEPMLQKAQNQEQLLGPTTIQAGTLQVGKNGANKVHINSLFTVQDGSTLTLCDQGFIGGLILAGTSSVTLSQATPGGAAAPFSLGREGVTFIGTSTYGVTVNDTSATSIKVASAVNLAGTLSIKGTAPLKRKVYTAFMTATSITGTFAHIKFNDVEDPKWTVSLAKESTQLTLTFNPT